MTTQKFFTSKKFRKSILLIIEGSFLMADLNPVISEPIRYGSLFAVQAISDNIYVSAATFGIVTLALDILGTIAAADLLSTRRSTNIINKTNLLIKKAGLARLLTTKTGIITDFNISLLVGTPVTLVLKQGQDPERSRQDNIRFGVYLSIIASFVSALQGGAVVAGLWHPNSLSISLAVVAVASLITLQRWLKRQFGQ